MEVALKIALVLARIHDQPSVEQTVKGKARNIDNATEILVQLMAGGQHGGHGVRAARLVDGDSNLGHGAAFLHLFMEAKIVLAGTGNYGHAI